MSVSRFFASSEQMWVWNRLKSLVWCRCSLYLWNPLLSQYLKFSWSINSSNIASLLSMMLPYDFSWPLSLILYLKTNAGLPILYLHEVWHLQEKLELKAFWTITLFPNRVNRNSSCMQVWHPNVFLFWIF